MFQRSCPLFFLGPMSSPSSSHSPHLHKTFFSYFFPLRPLFDHPSAMIFFSSATPASFPSPGPHILLLRWSSDLFLPALSDVLNHLSRMSSHGFCSSVFSSRSFPSDGWLSPPRLPSLLFPQSFFPLPFSFCLLFGHAVPLLILPWEESPEIARVPGIPFNFL